MQAICEHIKNFVEILHKERSIIRLAKLRCIVYMLKEHMEKIKASVCNIALCVFKSPNDCINNVFLCLTFANIVQVSDYCRLVKVSCRSVQHRNTIVHIHIHDEENESHTWAAGGI